MTCACENSLCGVNARAKTPFRQFRLQQLSLRQVSHQLADAEAGHGALRRPYELLKPVTHPSSAICQRLGSLQGQGVAENSRQTSGRIPYAAFVRPLQLWPGL